MNIILQMSLTKPIFLREVVDITKKILKVAHLLWLNEIGTIKRVFKAPKKPKISRFILIC